VVVVVMSCKLAPTSLVALACVRGNGSGCLVVGALGGCCVIVRWRVCRTER
jgi:hypothetical protein